MSVSAIDSVVLKIDEQILAAARARVEKEFSQKVMVEQYMAAYKGARSANQMMPIR